MGRHPFAHSMRWVSGVGNGYPDLPVREAQIQNFPPQNHIACDKSSFWTVLRTFGGIFGPFGGDDVRNFEILASCWGNFHTHLATHPHSYMDGCRVGVTHRHQSVGWVDFLPTHPSKSGTHPPNGCGYPLGCKALDMASFRTRVYGKGHAYKGMPHAIAMPY